MSAATTSASGSGPGVALARTWWVRGLALHERADRLGVTGPPRALSEDPDAIATRAADLGLDDRALAALLDAPADTLASAAPAPDWVAATERAVLAARSLDATHPVPEGWRDAFALVLRPFVDDAVTGALAGLAAHRPHHVDAAGITEGVRVAIGHRLAGLAARTLVTELHRTGPQLNGADGRARFADFVRRMSGPVPQTALFSRFPVLARLLATTAATTARATAEVLDRLLADRADLVAELLGGADPGPVVALTATRGDRHDGGRSVVFADFADGSRIVYKPRDVGTQVRFAELLAALNAAAPGLCPRAVRTVARDGYGWSELVTGEPLENHRAADRFYRRHGALLALLHVLRATDVHYENVIAAGEVPVLVDTETLFSAELVPGGTGDPAADVLAGSVYRTALLPMMVVGEQGIADLSGTGGDGGTSPASVVDWLDAGTDRMRLVRRAVELTEAGNRPRIGDALVEPRDHEREILAGFRQAYDVLSGLGAEFTELVSRCAGLEVRVITRPSWLYGTLLDETTHPEALADALDRDRALATLYAGRTASPLFAQLVTHEIAALWDGDVPMFLATAGTGRLRPPGGAELPVPLPRTGIDSALRTIAGLNEVERRDQEWIISATLATRLNAPAHPVAPLVRSTHTGTVVHPDELVVAACSVADRIVARAATTSDGRINWLGLETLDDRQWLVLPQGASLGHGYLGVALFLAQIGAVTGNTRYTEHAEHVVADAPAVIASLAGRPDLLAAVGVGGHNGLGGIAYGLARLGVLLDDPALRARAADVVELIAVTPTADPGWSSGLAGCLAALTAVHADLGLARAGVVAGTCADQLLGVDPLTLSPGFAHGLAGVAHALTSHGPDERHRAEGRRLAALATGETDRAGWCDGDAGLALAAGTGAVAARRRAGAR